MIKLKEFRTTAHALPDLLNYAAAIDNGIFLNKDGSLSAGFYYRSSDVSSVTFNERNLLAAKINSILSRLGNGWALHIDSSRTQVSSYIDEKSNKFTDKLSHLLDEERREFFTKGSHFETVYTMVFTYLPPHKNVTRMADLMIDDQANKKTPMSKKILDYFKNSLAEFENSISNYVYIKPMRSHKIIDEFNQVHYQDDFLEFTNFAISGNRHPIQLPDVGMYLDSYIGAYEFFSGMRPKIGNKYIGIVAIDGFPSTSTPNILNDLQELSINYRWNTRFIFMDQHEANTVLTSYRRKWKQKVRGWRDELMGKTGGQEDEFAKQMVYETDSAIAESNSNLISFGYYSSNIIVFDENPERLEHNLKEVKSTIEKLGFTPRIESINAVEAYIGSLPGHTIQNVRRPIINTMNLSHLMPLSSIWAGEVHNSNDKYPPQSPPLMQTITHGSTPFRLNLHVGDIGHTMIFGPTGFGKSTLLANILIAHQRYPNSKTFAFDKGRSLLPATAGLQGSHFDIGNDDEELKLTFAPLANVKTANQIAWAESWIETCLVLQGVTMTPAYKKTIHQAMISHSSNGSKSLTDFVSNLQNNDLRDALNPYTVSGAMGYLLDGEDEDFDLSNAINTFEIEELINLGDKNLVPVLLYLFHRIEQSLDGSPAMIILDEAWIALGHPVFKEKIREWLKVLRKANCSVVLATQSLSDAAKSGLLDVLQESCSTKILLPNPNAFNKGTESNLGPYDFYKIFGLNDAQIMIVSLATKKREYYYISELGSRLFDLALGQINLAFTAAADKKSILEMKKIIADHGIKDFPFKWLDHKGVRYSHLLREAS